MACVETCNVSPLAKPEVVALGTVSEDTACSNMPCANLFTEVGDIAFIVAIACLLIRDMNLSTSDRQTLQTKSRSTKKKPTALRLWVFILVVVAGFEPATSAL